MSAFARRQTEAVPYYVSPELEEAGLVHGFFTRHGGVSRGRFASLNVSRAAGDTAEAVEENLARILGSLRLERARAVQLRQVHGCAILQAGRADGGYILGEADGVITDQPGLPLLLRFADCVPLVAFDLHRGVVGLAHAGWRGTLAGIAVSLVEAMGHAYGSRPQDLAVAIGPSVGPCHYPVGPEVEDLARRSFPALAAAWLAQDRRLDLRRANADQLGAAGVERLHLCGLCTACRTEEFFSVRGSGLPTGHSATVVALA